MTRSKQILGLVAWLGLAYAAAAIGGIASVRAAEFYQELQRPTWAPPGRVFGPVWSVLYTLIGISAWLVWREQTPRTRGALVLFIVQLAANALWSWIFFVWRSGLWATVEIAVLWLLIVVTLVAFARVRPLAAALLAPYLAWVTFATALTIAVWRMNPSLLGN